ncbi:MAG TPA: glycosyltransferase family 4 protein [Candidatus Acidoferrum sp.]|nr:glycosyltransferase family 4 protein [Candidatus Acidoferrum sp.]
MINTEFPPKVGGGGAYIHNLSKELIKRGHQVVVITRGSWKGLKTDRLDGIEVYRVPYIHVYPLLVITHKIFQNRIFNALRSNSDFDLLHFHQSFSPPINTTLPIIVTQHTSVGPGSFELQNFYAGKRIPGPLFSLMRSYVKGAEGRMLERADCITTVSKAMANELHNLHGTDPRAIKVLGNGVDTEAFVPGNGKPNEKIILYTGRLAYHKGVFDLVKAARHVLDEHPEVSFVLTGRGPIEQELRTMVTNMSMTNNFRFAGFVERTRLIELYQNATVYVFPSYYEGLPTTILEAMACETPVVATAIDGIREVIIDGKNGFTVPVKNPEAIASVIVRLLDDEELRKRIGQAARQTILEHYTWNEVANRTLKCYNDLLRAM